MASFPKRPIGFEKTIGRRDWMEWVGKATVLSLGSTLLTHCTKEFPLETAAETEDAGNSPDQWTDESADEISADTDIKETEENTHNQTTDMVETEEDTHNQTNDASCDEELTGDDAFAAGAREAKEIFDNWPIRTVDQQDISWILENWRLEVDGMVDTPMTFSFADLLALKRQDQIVDFHCVEGWSVLDVPWNGFHIDEILNLVKPDDDASHITFHTIDGNYNESLPIDVAREPKTMLAYGIDCATIPIDHGFPLRLVVPRLLAYKSAKYIQRIEFTNRPIDGYWVAKGYSYDGEVPESRLREGKF